MTLNKSLTMFARACVLSLLSLSLSGCSLTLFAPPAIENPPTPANLVVEITGTPGMTFEGTLGESPSNQSIAGTVPAQYTVVTAVAVAVTVTKKQEVGELTVRILRNGKEVARRMTTSSYGMVVLIYKVF